MCFVVARIRFTDATNLRASYPLFTFVFHSILHFSFHFVFINTFDLIWLEKYDFSLLFFSLAKCKWNAFQCSFSLAGGGGIINKDLYPRSTTGKHFFSFSCILLFAWMTPDALIRLDASWMQFCRSALAFQQHAHYANKVSKSMKKSLNNVMFIIYKPSNIAGNCKKIVFINSV